MKKIVKYFLLLLPLLAIISCKEDPIENNPSGETILYKNIYIVNGGLSGGDRYPGVFKSEADSLNHIITFDNVAAESDIQHLRFAAYMSLGSTFDQESYDFLEGQADPNATTLQSAVRVISGNNTTDYTVILNMTAPQSKPMVSKIEVETTSGRVVGGVIDIDEKMIYLNTPSETQVTVKSVTLIPVRATYAFTDAAGNKLSIDNPGSIELDFMGITDSYRIFFDDAPAAGINFGAPIIHDFSLKTGSVYPDFVAENTRSADFDGEHILIVSREGGINPKLLRASDVLANNASAPIMLKTTDIEGGTYLISAGRLAQGHIYICNLTTGLADTDAGKLKLYHWETPNSDPELILDFNGIIDDAPASTGRFGDNISLDLDEDGNGYVYFVHQSANETFRFTITGFTTVSDPVLMKPGDAFYYGCYNQVGDKNEYLYTSTVAAVVKLLDKDGVELTQVSKRTHDGMDASRGTDSHIINYNSGRYMIMTSGRQQNTWAFPALFIYDISEGFNTVSALVNYQDAAPNPSYFYEMGESAASGGCAGIAAWAPVDGKLCIFAAAPRSGFVLIEFPKNQK